MNKQIKDKIERYRKQKSTRASFENRIAEANDTLKKLIKGSENDSPNETYSHHTKISNNAMIDHHQRQYFARLEQLQQTKLKVLQLNNNLKTLELELKFERENLQKLNKQYENQKQRNQLFLQQKRQNLDQQRKQYQNMLKNRLDEKLDYIDKLLDDKDSAMKVIQNFVEKKRGFEERMKRMKETFVEQIGKNKIVWGQQQKKKREKWEEKKTQEINANTLKGVEPNIQRIVQNGKTQIKRIQEKHQRQLEEHKNEKTAEYQGRVREMKQEASHVCEAEKQEILISYSQKLQTQYEKLESQFEQDRERMRSTYADEIRSLQSKRKNETEQFIDKHKSFYMTHLHQMREMKQKYEKQIAQLDGTINSSVQKQEVQLVKKLQKEHQAAVEEQKNILRAKLQKFKKKTQDELEQKHMQFVEEVACQNDRVEAQLRLQTEQKIKIQRSKYEQEIKSLRKTIKALQAKIATVFKEKQNNQEQKGQIQEEYLKEEQENKFLMKQLAELQRTLHELKTEEESSEMKEAHQLGRIEQRWEDESRRLENRLLQLEDEIEATARIMIERMEDNQKERLQQINKMEQEAIKLNNRREEQIAKLKMEKVKLLQLGQSYKQALAKQLEMEKKFRGNS